MGSEHSGSTVMLCRKSTTQISLVMLFKSVNRRVRELVNGFGRGFVSCMSPFVDRWLLQHQNQCFFSDKQIHYD